MKRYYTGKEKNVDIRIAINKSGMDYYEVAELLSIHPTTFSSWLQRELSKEKKELILSVLKEVCKNEH